MRPTDAPSDLLRRIGQRIHDERRLRGESRAALGLRAGLSVRFLAQVESGEANISLLRLLEVAQALGLGLEALLGFPGAEGKAGQAGPGDGGSKSVAREVERLLAPRTDVELAEVRDWLATRFGAPGGPLVALLGLRGAGKSSVGPRLARTLGVPFFELDALVESTAGLPLDQIFELHGEPYYRRLERETLSRFLAAHSAGVLAVGGGIVTEPETWTLLRRRCRTVWLRATPELHWQRVVRQGDRRPMRDNPDAMHELKSLLAAREPLYAQADVMVETSGRAVAQVVAAVLASISATAPGSAGGGRPRKTNRSSRDRGPSR